MAEEKREPQRELNRAPEPVPGKRKPPSQPVKSLPPKRGGMEPTHGGPSASLHAALDDVQYPVTRRELLEQVGDRVIGLGDGRTVSVRTAIQRTARAEYGSAQEVVAEVNAIWDDVERAAHGG